MFGRHQAREEPAKDTPEQSWLTDPSVPSRACCCPGRPAFKVTMPAAKGRRDAVDLWLCGHHYNASRPALSAAGATAESLPVPDDPVHAYRATAVA